ncbi:MAG: Spy/CpxP family protein refolding chaperone [Burkholderiales bacterium]
MNFSTKTLVAALFGLALLPVAGARAQDQHHEPDAATAAPSAGTPAEQPAAMTFPQMMMPMMNMMGQQSQGMPMMDMMGQGGMGMMGQGTMPMGGAMSNLGMPMQGMGAHLEGRIAFLRAELAITEAQAPQWDAFAQALRDSTTKLKQAQAAAPQAAAATFLQRAEFQEHWLVARLEGLKEVKTAFAGLQAVLSEDQKKNAEALLTQPVCLGQMGMM